MKLIVGLGNPGLRYRNTRHNAGFLAVNAFAKKNRISLRKRGFNGQYGISRFQGEEIMLFEPLTFMNLSGDAVKGVLAGKAINNEDILVLSDDLDLPLGSIRIREKGSSGGHNGLRSIIGKIGEDFTRIRIGIGRETRMEDTSSYVLSSFSREEKRGLGDVLERAVEAIEVWINGGTKEAMNRCNG